MKKQLAQCVLLSRILNAYFVSYLLALSPFPSVVYLLNVVSWLLVQCSGLCTAGLQELHGSVDLGTIVSSTPALL